MLGNVVAILAGFALLAYWLKGGAARFGRRLAEFNVVIGVFALVLGILVLFSPLGIMLILAGLILTGSALRNIPYIGDSLARFAFTLDDLRLIIGVLVLVVGLFGLISGLLHF